MSDTHLCVGLPCLFLLDISICFLSVGGTASAGVLFYSLSVFVVNKLLIIDRFMVDYFTHSDALAEWLRRVPAKYMGFPRESSNLSGVAGNLFFLYLFTYL